MNKDLMMKAAVQFKGKWPVGFAPDHTCLAACINEIANMCKLGEISIVSEKCHKKYWEIFCTREQFESFVESLFEGAPDDVTYKGTNDLFYKIVDNSAYYLNSGNKWASDNNGEDWLSKNLIPRPAKKADPEATYMPKVGEKIEVYGCTYGSDDVKWFKAEVMAVKDGKVLAESTTHENVYEFYSSDKFRPLITEHEKLTDALVNIMIINSQHPDLKSIESYKQLAEAILSDENINISLKIIDNKSL